MAYGQEEISLKKNHWAISSDASSYFNFINGTASEGVIFGKYFFTEKMALMAGMSFAGVSLAGNVDSNPDESMKEGALGLNLGVQYFLNSDKRFRPFLGMKIAYSTGGGIEKDERNDKISSVDIYTSPFYATIGVGAEYFLTDNISLSTDVGVAFACSIDRNISYSYESGKVVDYGSTFVYATCMGGLGGKLALNIYF